MKTFFGVTLPNNGVIVAAIDNRDAQQMIRSYSQCFICLKDVTTIERNMHMHEFFASAR